MQRTRLRKKTWICVLLAAVMALGIGFIAIPLNRTSAATVKTSNLYTSADNVRYKGTESGTEMTVTNYTSGAVNFKNTLYMKDMAIEFSIKSNNFDKLTFSFLSQNTDETKVEKVENKVEFLKNGEGADAKLDIRFIDGSLSEQEQKEVKAVSTAAKFENAQIKLSLTDGLFKAGVGGTDYTAANALTKSIYYNEATLKISFTDIDEKDTSVDKPVDVVAKIVISSINGQSMSETNGAITDAVDPVVQIDYGTYNLIDSNGTITKFSPETVAVADMTDAKTFLAGSRTNMNVPVRLYDVLQTSLDASLALTRIKDADGNAIAEDDQTTKTVTGTNCYFEEQGVYKIVVSLKTGNADEKVERVLFVKTVEDKAVPKIDSWDVTSGQYAPAGSAYQIKRPEISDTLGIDTKFNVKYIVWYKSPSASDWTQTSGLSFTPSSQGMYMIKVQVDDASGNHSAASANALAIEFRDEDAPKLTISGFPKSAYVKEEITLPAGSASDTVDSAPTKTVKVCYLGETGSVTDAFKEDEEIELKNNAFTPEKTGYYLVVYTAKDAAGFVTTENRLLKVITDERPKINPIFENFWNGWTITLVVIAGLALIGILLLIFIKPDKKKQAKKD